MSVCSSASSRVWVYSGEVLVSFVYGKLFSLALCVVFFMNLAIVLVVMGDVSEHTLTVGTKCWGMNLPKLDNLWLSTHLNIFSMFVNCTCQRVFIDLVFIFDYVKS